MRWLQAALLVAVMAGSADATPLDRVTFRHEHLLAEVARRSLRAFVEHGWSIVESVPFVPNWHIDALCGQLERVTSGEISRLLINVPPGTSKSLITSVFWPAWELASIQTRRYITASYGQDLATRDAVRMRVLIESEWFQEHWPIAFRNDENQKTRYAFEQGGWRIATSVGGRGTGEHPDRVIIDDPHNIKDVEYAMRLTYSGEFLHAAPWSVADQGHENVSHGCTGMSTENAKWLYDRSRIGDVVIYTGSNRPMQPWNGIGLWNTPYDEWTTGSALVLELL